MASVIKHPANRRTSNVWRNLKTSRWHWEVELTRLDGTKFRKAGSRKNEKEALSARDEAFALFNVNQGASEGHTIRSWVEHCLTEVFVNEHQENSTAVYAYTPRKHALPLIGGIPLVEANTKQLQIFFNDLRERTSESVAIKVRTGLSSCLTRAVMQAVIPTNPATYVRIKKAAATMVEPDENDEDERADKRILTQVEQAALLKAARGNLIEPAVWLGLKLGMRLGECLGLQWSSVNLERGTVRVKQQLKRITGKGLEVRPPKTAAGVRTLRIPDSLMTYLKQAKSEADTKSVAWVCPNRSGGMLDPRRAVQRFSEVAAKSEVAQHEDGTKVFVNGQKSKPDATHHDCRSTLLSYLANHADDGRGIRPAVLKSIAGHSKIDTTMRYYVRASQEDVMSAMAHIP